jgi:ABC-2 type transport system permease protein
MGIFLVPSLLFEEKETKTMQALLVSPASISQVVLGKALAGVFYILVTALVIFAFSFAEVVHWEIALLFVACGAFFSVAIGLLLGSLFDKQQDMVGWMTGLLLFLVGAILVQSLNMQLPVFVKEILPWLPSVALADICRVVYSEVVPSARILIDVIDILVFSLPIYAVVIWRIRRSDR